MAHDIKFILINADDGFATHVREVLLKFPGRKIIAEVEEPALFAQAIKQFPVDVAVVNLDPNPEALMPILGSVIADPCEMRSDSGLTTPPPHRLIAS